MRNKQSLSLLSLPLISIILFLLSGCSVYKSQFAYGSANGVGGIPMDYVDRMISNGEIEKYQQIQVNSRGKKSKSQNDDWDLEAKQTNILPAYFKDSKADNHANDKSLEVKLN